MKDLGSFDSFKMAADYILKKLLTQNLEMRL